VDDVARSDVEVDDNAVDDVDDVESSVIVDPVVPEDVVPGSDVSAPVPPGRLVAG
jgi:hypothetical protein